MEFRQVQELSKQAMGFKSIVAITFKVIDQLPLCSNTTDTEGDLALDIFKNETVSQTRPSLNSTKQVGLAAQIGASPSLPRL
jgi:hypothetical protein